METSSSESDSDATIIDSPKPSGVGSTITEQQEEVRRVANRLAQSKFRARTKEQKESHKRDLENQKQADAAYVSVDPSDLNVDLDLTGLPWGGISISHILETGRRKAQCSATSSDQTIDGLGTRSGSDKHDSSVKYIRLAESGSQTLPDGNRSNSASPRPHFDCGHTGCGQSFGRRSDLKHHEKSHLASYERPYVCRESGCNKTFVYPKDLKRHQRTHESSNAPQYLCDVEGCQYARKGFHRKDNLLRHMRAQHLSTASSKVETG